MAETTDTNTTDYTYADLCRRLGDEAVNWIAVSPMGTPVRLAIDFADGWAYDTDGYYSRDGENLAESSSGLGRLVRTMLANGEALLRLALATPWNAWQPDLLDDADANVQIARIPGVILETGEEDFATHGWHLYIATTYWGESSLHDTTALPTCWPDFNLAYAHAGKVYETIVAGDDPLLYAEVVADLTFGGAHPLEDVRRALAYTVEENRRDEHYLTRIAQHAHWYPQLYRNGNDDSIGGLGRVVANGRWSAGNEWREPNVYILLHRLNPEYLPVDLAAADRRPEGETLRRIEEARLGRRNSHDPQRWPADPAAYLDGLEKGLLEEVARAKSSQPAAEDGPGGEPCGVPDTVLENDAPTE